MKFFKSVWNGLESAGRQEGLPGCEVVGLVVVEGESSLGGAGSGVVGSAAEGHWGRAYARLVAGRGGATVREVVKETAVVSSKARCLCMQHEPDLLRRERPLRFLAEAMTRKI